MYMVTGATNFVDIRRPSTMTQTQYLQFLKFTGIVSGLSRDVPVSSQSALEWLKDIIASDWCSGLQLRASSLVLPGDDKRNEFSGDGENKNCERFAKCKQLCALRRLVDFALISSCNREQEHEVYCLLVTTKSASPELLRVKFHAEAASLGYLKSENRVLEAVTTLTRLREIGKAKAQHTLSEILKFLATKKTVFCIFERAGLQEEEKAELETLAERRELRKLSFV
jgi:hypothetical protein